MKKVAIQEKVEAAPARETSGEPGGTPWQVLWLKLRSNRVAMAGLYTLVLLYGLALLAGPVSPYNYETASPGLAFHPPMIAGIHFLDEEGRPVRPFVYGAVLDNLQLRTYHYDPKVRYPIRFLVRGDSYNLFWGLRWDVHLFGVDSPGRLFLMGSDYVGRDILSRLLYGARISLTVGLAGIAISTVLGMMVGGIAGYYGGLVDFVLMRAVEVLLALPSLYFILILRQAFGSGLSSTEIYLIIVVIMALVGWAMEARVIRGMVLSLREQEFVVAARALGMGSLRIIVRHILPNTLSFAIVTATLSVPFYILGEVALSFLGVGIQEPEASWGNMLSNAQNNRYLVDFPWILAPGVLIFIAVMAWNSLGDGLRDAADPRTLN